VPSLTRNPIPAGMRISAHATPFPRRNILALGSLIALLPGCKIVHNGAADKTDPQKPDSFDANAYVYVTWPKVSTFFQANAHDLATVLSDLAKNADAADKAYGQAPAADGGAWTFAVKGQGRVTQSDVKSAHGTLTLDLPNVSSPVILQVGPVVFGSAVRDCLPFLNFATFVHQIEYAEVSHALNTRAMAGIRHGVDFATLIGKTITFSGGMADPSATGEIDVTPVTLTVSNT
jgi:predicted lipoprotein